MNNNEIIEAATALAEGMLKIRFPEGLPGMGRETSEEYIHRFVSREVPECDTRKLTFEKLIRLFEKYCEFEQMKSALR